jgi:hypothetical protein
MTRDPLVTQRLLNSEDFVNQPQGGLFGFWLTNPDNAIRNNLAADTSNNGF